jgi:hypothetical protein
MYAADNGYDPDMQDIILSHRYDTVVMRAPLASALNARATVAEQDKKILAL